MAAITLTVVLLTLCSDEDDSPSPHIAMLFSFTFLLSLTLFILISTVLCTIFKNSSRSNNKDENPVIKVESLPKNVDESAPQQMGREDDPQNVTRLLLLEILPPTSPKWDAILVEKSKDFGDESDCETGSGQEKRRRKKKKRARKKRPDPSPTEEEDKEDLVCSYPFTKASSATQRKIKQHYDQLVKSHGTTGLTLEQFGRFVNCLVDARHELQSKSDVIKRKFTIMKALLCKADRSSFYRIRQQICKLELEQKRLEEDAFVYNWLQEQIKVAPAYKKLIEVSAGMEEKAKSRSLVDSTDAYFSDMSFEEFLAQEKKDAFWQKKRET